MPFMNSEVHERYGIFAYYVLLLKAGEIIQHFNLFGLFKGNLMDTVST